MRHAISGPAFVEILQNCNVFNDGAFDSFAATAVRQERSVYLQHGRPMIFGAKKDRAIRLRAGFPEIVSLDDFPEPELLVFKESAAHPGLAYMLSELDEHDFPVPIGVFRCVDRSPFGELLTSRSKPRWRSAEKADLFDYINSGDTWEVTAPEGRSALLLRRGRNRAFHDRRPGRGARTARCCTR